MTIKIGIIGATGYTGLELIKILLKHQEVELKYLTSVTFAGRDINDVFPELKKKNFSYRLHDLDLESKELAGLDIVFIALPHGHSMQIAPILLEKNIKVIDLGADFRYQDIKLYEKIYQEHTANDVNKQAVYGLPEYFRKQIKKAKLIANPGCYVTAATLALKPLIDSDNFVKNSIIVDAKSGYSGAGRNFVEGLKFPDASEKFSAYKVGVHRHQSEIEQNLNTPVLFAPHLLPVFRGILATCYVTVEKTLDQKALAKLYKKQYQDEPFVEIVDALPDIKDVANTNMCKLHLLSFEKEKKVVIVSVLDNLVKGASGQAVQNMNIMCGFTETTGLKGEL